MPLYRVDNEQTPTDYGPLLGHTTNAWKAPSPGEASNQSVLENDKLDELFIEADSKIPLQGQSFTL